MVRPKQSRAPCIYFVPRPGKVIFLNYVVQYLCFCPEDMEHSTIWARLDPYAPLFIKPQYIPL